MNISNYDGSKLRLILVGMITDPKVCSRICSLMSKKNGPRFNVQWADLIAKWCCDYLRKYGRPPERNIQFIFHKWAETSNAEAETIDQIESLLQYMSDEYGGGAAGSSDFVLDLATDYFNSTQLKQVVSTVENTVASGRLEDAYKQLASTPKIELGYSSVINPFTDMDVWVETFNEDRIKPLFEYPGDLGRLIGPVLTRGTLFSFMGVEKVGKSYFLMDAAFRALKRRHRIAYFEVGDLGKEETITRLGQRILRQSVFTETVQWPVGWEAGKDIPLQRARVLDGVSIGHAIRLARKYTRNRDLLKISCHANSSINVQGIHALLEEWAREMCWIPDMVVIDYADILAPPDGVHEANEQIDETWKQLRRLSQTFNALVLTATQTGSQAYRKRGKALAREDFGGRKTKMAHVNGMIGLSSNPEDTKYNVTRINWVVRRKGASRENEQVVVAGCHAAGSPVILCKPAEKRYIPRADKKNTEDGDGSED